MGKVSKSLAAGALLGVFCIIGIGYRVGFAGNELFLFSAWFNRVLMGLVVGLAAEAEFMKGQAPWTRGALLGLLVSLAWFLSTDMRDSPGFLAGIAYGVAIDWLATKRA